MELDLTDVHVRAMAEVNHLPREYWHAMTGDLVSVACRECGREWPCDTRKQLTILTKADRRGRVLPN